MAAFSVAIALICGLISGCGKTGTAVPEVPDLQRLDVGDFGAEPLAEPADDDESYSRIIESARMGEGVVNPSDLDKSFSRAASAVLPTPNDTTGILADVARPVLASRGMIAGYSIGGYDRLGSDHQPIIGKTNSLRLTVLRFPDDTSARDAAAEIDTADFAVNPDNQPVAIPNYDGAHSHWRPQLPTLGVTAAHGSFVVALFITRPTTDLTVLTATATAALDAELPFLDKFTPTPADKLRALALDQDGMLRRSLPSQRGKWPYPAVTPMDWGTVAGYGRGHLVTGVVFGPSGADHKTRNTALDPVATGRPAVERLAVVDGRWLSRWQDATRARRYFDLQAAENAKDEEIVPGPTGVPDAKCFRDRVGEDVFCQVMDGRYVAELGGHDAKTVLQQAAAQYALLVKTR
ncbi:DUF7373 family lipoprotein [Nocardia sp. CDC160]|uniref:DUF7373 family lipoprotein n=1 Tax=Nocardia sp. CDC160 TaxID=3112166 RepID=UPI002DBE7046|nr:hypothetical protein [Nocardia sp. CDC160]MEC3917974.1 hypothetical protein [Nocardia sp. CDC160]